VAKWRSGFYHIAVGAGVPILPVYFHYPERRIGIAELFHPSGDMDADLRALQQIYAPWKGKDGKSALPE
jgi:1-acyl-sn-glycerol-3-phosphate acyltransferase